MSIQNKAMLVRLSISQWTARKYDKKVSREVASAHNTAEHVGRYNKQLIAKNALEAINKIVSAARTLHYRYTLPWYDDGARMLPSANYFAYTQEMRALHDQFATEVENFMVTYPSLKTAMAQELKSLYNPDDYPNSDTLRTKFAFDISVIPVPSAQDFRINLGDEETRRIQQDITRRTKEAQDTAMQDLWQRVKQTVERIQERLSNPEAKFHASLIDNARDLVQLLPKLNFMDDPTLEQIRRDIEDQLCQYDPDELRVNTKARKQTAASADAIMATMSGYMGVAA